MHIIRCMMSKESPLTAEELGEYKFQEHMSLCSLERICSFSDLLPVGSFSKVAPELSYRYPSSARESFKQAAEYYGGTTEENVKDRLDVIKRINEVVKPLSFNNIPPEVFPLQDIKRSDYPDLELKTLYNHISDLLLSRVLKEEPHLKDDIAHVYALAETFYQQPGIDKVLLRTSPVEKIYQARIDLLKSYVKEKGLTQATLDQAQGSGIEIKIDPKDPYHSIAFDITWFMSDMFSRAMVIGRFDDAEEIGKLAFQATEIMLTKEPKDTDLLSNQAHWKFVSENFPQLKKEFLYISGAAPDFK